MAAGPASAANRDVRERQHRLHPFALAALFLEPLGLAGCGGSTSPDGPPTPQLLQAVTGAGRQVMVSWAAMSSPGLDHYVIYWRQGSGPQVMLTKVNLSERGRVIPRLQPGTCSFAVEAVDAAGRASPRSAEVAVTVLPAPQAAIPLGTDGAPNGFYEYLPPGYGDGVPRPLLVFWHGWGMSGNGSFDLDSVLACCPPGMVNEGTWPASLPFVLLSPQTSTNCQAGKEIGPFIAWALAHCTVDPKRVFLTGSSCGSERSWNYLANHTDQQVAAALLMAGDPGSAWTQAGCDLGKVAIWAFHSQFPGSPSGIGFDQCGEPCWHQEIVKTP
jgi:hypothetical protein